MNFSINEFYNQLLPIYLTIPLPLIPNLTMPCLHCSENVKIIITTLSLANYFSYSKFRF